MNSADRKAWRAYLHSAARKHLSAKEVRSYLLTSGYDEKTVDAAFKDYRRSERMKTTVPAIIGVLVALCVLFFLRAPHSPTGFVTVTATPTVVVDYSVSRSVVPANFYGFHGATWGGNASLIDANNDGNLETASNYQAHRSAMLDSRANLLRRDMNLNNVINADGTFNRQTWSNGGNIDNAKSQVEWAAQNGYRVMFETTFMPRWLANNNSACSYGAVGISFVTCEPSSYARWGEIVVDFLDEAGCDTYPDVCMVEVWNEPYLPQFWQSNGTCQQRTDAYKRLYNATYAAVKTAYPNMQVGGPSGYYNQACGINLTTDFLLSTPTSMVDFVSIHQYANNNLAALISASMNNIRAAGHGKDVKITEFGAGTPAVEVNQTLNQTLYLTDALASTLNNHSNLSSMVLFEWANDNRWSDGVPNYAEWPFRRSMFAEPAFENTRLAPFNVTQNMATYHSAGSTVVQSSETSTLLVLGSKKNGAYSLTVGNRGSTQANPVVGINGLAASSVRDVRSGVTYPVANGQVTLSIAPFTVNYYTIEVAYATPNTAPLAPTPVLLSENNSNQTSDNLVCTSSFIDLENSSITARTQWYRNGVSYGTQSNLVVSNSTNATISLSSSLLAIADQWRCSMQAFDGSNSSPWVNSSMITIIAAPLPPPAPSNGSGNNTTSEPPTNNTTVVTHPAFTGFTTTATAATIRGSTVSWSATIEDATGLWSWVLSTESSGTSQTIGSGLANGATSATISAQSIVDASAGNSVCATLLATNLLNHNNSTSPLCFTVANTLPSAASLLISSDQNLNTTFEPLHCTATLFDHDEQPIQATVTWLRNGITHSVANYHNYSHGSYLSATLPLGTAAAGESWSCALGLSDGIASVSLGPSAAIVISNPPDTTQPIIILGSPSNGVSTNNTSTIFDWSVSDPSSPITCDVYLDGEIINTQLDASSWNTSANLSIGAHNWQVRCADAHNNIGYSSVSSFVVSQPPEADSSSTSSSSSGGRGGRGGSGGGGTVVRNSEESSSSAQSNNDQQPMQPISTDTSTVTQNPDEFASPLVEEDLAIEPIREEEPTDEVLSDSLSADTVIPAILIVVLLAFGTWKFIDYRNDIHCCDEEVSFDEVRPSTANAPALSEPAQLAQNVVSAEATTVTPSVPSQTALIEQPIFINPPDVSSSEPQSEFSDENKENK